LVLVQWQCNVAYFGIVDDVMFSHNRGDGPAAKLMYMFRRVAALEAKSAVSDCILLIGGISALKFQWQAMSSGFEARLYIQCCRDHFQNLYPEAFSTFVQFTLKVAWPGVWLDQASVD